MQSGRREPVDGGGSPVGREKVASRSLASSASIAPVGLEIEVDNTDERVEPAKEEAHQTGLFPVPMQRRRLGAVVVGTVAGCALILIAAVVARVSHASNEPTPRATAAKSASAATTPGNLPTSWEQPRPTQGPGLSPVAVSSQSVAGPIGSEVPSTGTVRLSRPSAAGHVWLDGKKLTSTSALVGCGVHQIKIGAHARPRSVDVPCGGEIVLSK